MIEISFDSEDLKVDYLSFNFQFNNTKQIQRIADFLTDTFHYGSTLLDQSNKKRYLLIETNQNYYNNLLTRIFVTASKQKVILNPACL